MERLGGSKYVIQLFSVVEDDENFVMVEELATGNDVMTRIEELLKTNSHFSEKVASRIFKEMLLGVKQCHDKVRMSGASVMRPLVWQHGLRTKACLVDSPRCSTLFVSVPTVRAARRAPRPQAGELFVCRQHARCDCQAL